MLRTLLVRAMLAEFDDLRVVGEAADGDDALIEIARLRPDVVFLDIEMPGRSGMEVAAALEPPRPRIIFCTAFDEYAVDAFEHHALAYLLKPLQRGRLERALQRVRQSLDGGEQHRREVADASDAQARLFPRAVPTGLGLDLAGACRSARGVGGDYYDFVTLPQGRLGIAVGDVSGKGLFAGLLMAGLQARVQSLAPLHGDDVGALARELNGLLLRTTERGRYVTLFYGVYDDASRVLTYFNAGHTPPIVLSPAREASSRPMIRRLEPTGTVIGMIEGARHDRARISLAPGDLIIAYTDGLTEARAPSGRELGEDGVARRVREHASLPAHELRDAVLRAVDGYRGGGAREDDMTLVIAKVQ
jgi:sigma-B regulation protein RsbU (phosphoserine phosphatase)